MAEPEVEAAWRAEFERSGTTQRRDAANNSGDSTHELKKQIVFRWVGDKAETQRLQEEKTYHYVKAWLTRPNSSSLAARALKSSLALASAFWLVISRGPSRQAVRGITARSRPTASSRPPEFRLPHSRELSRHLVPS
jgi:hypothetical protein